MLIKFYCLEGLYSEIASLLNALKTDTKQYIRYLFK